MKGLTRKEAAKFCGVSESAIQKWLSADKIHLLKSGGFSKIELRKAMKTRMNVSHQQRAKKVGRRPKKRDGASLYELQRKDLELKIRQRDAIVRRQSDETFDKKDVKALIDKRSDAMREGFLNWPARISSSLAARLGAEERLVRTELDREVINFLREMQTQARGTAA